MRESICGHIEETMKNTMVSEARLQTMFKTYRAVEEFLRNSIKIRIALNNNPFSLLVYGSAMNGLCMEKDSDLDLTLIVKDYILSHEMILEAVREALLESDRFDSQNAPI